jgi:hypothetical protein
MRARENMVKMGTKIGAAVGVIAFLVFGLVPGFFFGSYGSLIVISHLMGGPVEPTALIRVVMAIGILLGIVCVASVSIVTGAILGTGVGYLLEALSAPKEIRKPVKDTVEAK